MRLIKEPKRKVEAGGAGPSLSFASTTATDFVAGRRLFFFPRLIFSFQKTAAVFFLAACVYASLVFVRVFAGRHFPAVPQAVAKTETLVLPPQERGLKSYEFYEASLKGRPLFGGVSAAVPEPARTALDVDITKVINLVGIISGANPQAVIEDKKTQKTYYVSQGQWIGEFQLEEILEGKIVLNQNGQRFELSL